MTFIEFLKRILFSKIMSGSKLFQMFLFFTLFLGIGAMPIIVLNIFNTGIIIIEEIKTILLLLPFIFAIIGILIGFKYNAKQNELEKSIESKISPQGLKIIKFILWMIILPIILFVLLYIFGGGHRVAG